MIPFSLYLSGCIFIAGFADIRIYRNIYFLIPVNLEIRKSGVSRITGDSSAPIFLSLQTEALIRINPAAR